MVTANVPSQYRRRRAPRVFLEVPQTQRDHGKLRALWCGASTSTSSRASDPHVLVVVSLPACPPVPLHVSR
eukprot:8283381-Pyramimonas_sp.AAC.1